MPWEKISDTEERFKTFNGWLVRTVAGGMVVGLAYIPDSTGLWKIESNLPAPNPQPEPEPVPVPAPTPIPPPPSGVTRINVSKTQFLKLENGIYKSLPGWEDVLTSIEFKVPNASYGMNFRAQFWRKTSYPSDQSANWKWLRVWKGSQGGYPNWYIGQPYRGWILLYGEKLNVIDNQTRFDLPGSIFPPANVWRKEEYVWKAPSALGAKDGTLLIKINDTKVFETKNWQQDDGGSPGVADYISIQDDPSNYRPPLGSTVEYKDVIVETWK